MAGSWDRPGRDCPGVDGTTALLTMTVQSLHLYCQSGWHDSCGVGAYVPAFRPVIPQSADIAIAGATAKGSGNSLLIHFSPLQDWLPHSHYILNRLKARRRKALYRLAIELLQGTSHLRWQGSPGEVRESLRVCQSPSESRCSRCPRCQWYNQTGVPTRTATMFLIRFWIAYVLAGEMGTGVLGGTGIVTGLSDMKNAR